MVKDLIKELQKFVDKYGDAPVMTGADPSYLQMFKKGDKMNVKSIMRPVEGIYSLSLRDKDADKGEECVVIYFGKNKNI